MSVRVPATSEFLDRGTDFRYQTSGVDVPGMFIEETKPAQPQSDVWRNLDDALAWCGWRIARDLQQAEPAVAAGRIRSRD